jgi:hypothetical protein
MAEQGDNISVKDSANGKDQPLKSNDSNEMRVKPASQFIECKS